jgi:hypothetical protein
MSDLRKAVRELYLDLLREREKWAKSDLPCAAQRAILYQGAAARVMRVLDENPESEAIYLHPPHDRLGGLVRQDLGGLT